VQNLFYILSVPQVVATLKLEVRSSPMGYEKKRKVNRLLEHNTNDCSSSSAEEGRIATTPRQTGPIPHAPHFLGPGKSRYGPYHNGDPRGTAFYHYGSKSP